MRLPRGGPPCGGVKFLGAFLQDIIGKVIEQNTLGQGDTLETVQTVHRSIREFMHGRYSDTSHQAAIIHHRAFADVYVIPQTVQRYSIVIAVLGDTRYLLRLEGIILKEYVEIYNIQQLYEIYRSKSLFISYLENV